MRPPVRERVGAERARAEMLVRESLTLLGESAAVRDRHMAEAAARVAREKLLNAARMTARR